MRPRQGPVKFWVDVSTLMRARGRVTGIPRTVSQFVEVWSRQPGLRLGVCAFNSWLRAYEEISLTAVPSPAPPARAGGALAARPPETRPSPRDRLRPLYRALPIDLQHACREGFAALRHLARFLLRSAWGSLANAAVGMARAAARRCRRGAERILFEDGDVLFIPGAGWDDLGAWEGLAKIKQTQKLFVVPIVYDVIPVKLPQVCDPLLPRLFNPWIRKLLALSDVVLTISLHSRRDLLALVEELGLPAPPVEVIRLGDEPVGFGRPARPVALPAGVESFALSVGTFEARKNHWLLYQVWRRLIEQFGCRVPALVLAGRPGWGTRDVLRQIQDDPLVRGRIIVLPDASDEELSWLYDHCQFTLYPSFYEGWGLPVAESLARGKHCICSDSSSVPEVGGDLADYHDPLDAAGCLELVRRAVFEPGYLAGREERIRGQFRRAAWAECAAELLPVLERDLGVRLTDDPPAAEAA